MLSWCCFLIWMAYYRMFLAQDIICVIIFKSLLQQLFFFFPLAQRDGKPVYPGQKSVSFLNNNINPKVSSSMNGMFHILKVSPVKKKKKVFLSLYI